MEYSTTIEYYVDSRKLSSDNINKMIEIFKRHNIIYAQIFGSYLEGEEYQDIDILIMSSTPKDIFLELLNSDLQEVLKEKIDCVPLNYVDNIFKYSVIDSKSIIYLNERYYEEITDEIEKIIHWNDFEGYRYRRMLDDFIGVND